jgi:hypothetical protein
MTIEIDNELSVTPEPKRKGRPPGRTAAPRETVREPVRTKGVVIGRDGQPLSRKRKGGIDVFEIPKSEWPPGYEYQWNPVSVLGNSDVVMDQNMGMYENGWRPVPAERHAGRFVAHGTKGDIIRGGQRLEERPTALCEEARREDVRTAKQLLTDRNDSLKLSAVRNGLANGMEMSNKYRGTGGNVRMSIDKDVMDIPSPSHTLAEPGDE